MDTNSPQNGYEKAYDFMVKQEAVEPFSEEKWHMAMVLTKITGTVKENLVDMFKGKSGKKLTPPDLQELKVSLRSLDRNIKRMQAMALADHIPSDIKQELRNNQIIDSPELVKSCAENIRDNLQILLQPKYAGLLHSYEGREVPNMTKSIKQVIGALDKTFELKPVRSAQL